MSVADSRLMPWSASTTLPRATDRFSSGVVPSSTSARDAQRERQRVSTVPARPRRSRRRQRVANGSLSTGSRSDGRQPDDVAVRRIGVGGDAGGSGHLLEQQVVASVSSVGGRSRERRAGSPRRQAAADRRPMDGTGSRCGRRGPGAAPQRLERRRAPRPRRSARGPLRAAVRRRRSAIARPAAARARGRDRPATVTRAHVRALQPSCIAVVEQRAWRRTETPPPGGAEVGLGRDRVLEVAEVVGDVGEQLDERDADVGRRCARCQSGIERPPAGRASAAGSSRSPWRGSRSRGAAQRLGRAARAGAAVEARSGSRP